VKNLWNFQRIFRQGRGCSEQFSQQERRNRGGANNNLWRNNTTGRYGPKDRGMGRLDPWVKIWTPSSSQNLRILPPSPLFHSFFSSFISLTHHSPLLFSIVLLLLFNSHKNDNRSKMHHNNYANHSKSVLFLLLSSFKCSLHLNLSKNNRYTPK
jgi:hypothetical protein